MPKFFVEPEAVCGDSITLSGPGAEHLKVLRVREGEELTVHAGGQDHCCAVEYAGGGTFRLQILFCNVQGKSRSGLIGFITCVCYILITADAIVVIFIVC